MNKIIKLNLKEHLDMFNKFNQDHFKLITNIFLIIKKTILRNGKIYLIGNGGSAADCQHFAAEMVVKYEKKRKSYPFISLTTDTSIITACSNDFSFEDLFTRQLESIIDKKDIVIAFSTSGKSKNIISALEFQKKKKITSVIFTGNKKNNCERYSKYIFRAPSSTVSRIQEMHIFCIHLLCNLIDKSK